MESIASLPISVVSTVLSSDDLYNQCDFCEYQGKRYLLCTSQHQIVICCESNSTDNCNGYEIVQIIQDVHLFNSITSIRWCKNGYSQVSSRGEFAVASTSFLTIYAPISDCCISPGYNKPTVVNMIIFWYIVELSWYSWIGWRNQSYCMEWRFKFIGSWRIYSFCLESKGSSCKRFQKDWIYIIGSCSFHDPHFLRFIITWLSMDCYNVRKESNPSSMVYIGSIS